MTAWLTNARTVDGRNVSVEVADGRLTEIAVGEPSGWTKPAEIIDLSGYLLLPSFVEPHAHLDKALTISR